MRVKSLVPALLFIGASCFAQNPNATTPASEPTKPISFDITAMDTTADPCADFSAYACGNWKKNNPIPADKTRWGRFDQLSERNTYLVYKIVSSAAADPKTPLQKKYGDYFAACMDRSLVNTLGAKPIDGPLSLIAAWDGKKPATFLGAMENKYATGFFFNFGSDQDQKDATKQIGEIDQAGLTLPDRSYYLDQDARMVRIRGQYLDHVKKMFVLLGDSPEKAASEADAVMKIETALAEGSMDRVARRDPHNVYHIMTITDLQQSTPSFDWNVYLAAKREGQLKTLNVASPNFFTTLNQQLSSADAASLKSYMRWHVVHQYASNLAEPFAQESFAFFGKTLSGQQQEAPLWRRCSAATDRALGETVGQDWVKQYFPPEAKDNMEKLVAALEKALGQDIQGLDWMSPETKTQAEAKLKMFREKVGYPQKWRDYSSITVKRDDLIGNTQRVAAFNDRRDLEKIGKPVDEKEWGMTPPTVNAYYNPSMNDINFPAGILQPPFFDDKIDPAVNYGAIGVVIGHEMTHGFDDQGSQYDGKGNVAMWWTADDRKKFDERTGCEVNEYNGFEVAPGQNLNGKLTLGENTADNGGLHVAYQALMSVLTEKGGDAMTAKVDGFTPQQRFFIGYAQLWCENTREETARMRAKTDPHSSGQWRINGVVQNSEDFGKAFSCKKGQPMMPTNACRVW